MRSKKIMLLVITISILLISSLFYINYLNRKIRVSNVKTEEVEVFSKYKDKGIDACFGTSFRCEKIDYKVKGKVDTKKVGTYVITYKINHKDKKVEKKKKVKVVDKTKPKLEIIGTHRNVCPNGKAEGVTFKATDNYDGDITDKIEFNVKENKMTYRVTDSSGNTATKEFDVVIEDQKKPELILDGDKIVYLKTGSTYVEPGYVAIDNCDGNITNKVKIEGNVDTSRTGTYELNYTATDSFGNKTTIKRTIKVFDKNVYNPQNIPSKTIYLTFDDGPGAYTARLLDILNKYDAKATFFVVGYNNRYDDLITREYNEGHTVALHSYAHRYEKIYSSMDSYMEDLLMLNDKVKNLTGHDSKIIRFPGGSSNTISRKYNRGIMGNLTKNIEELGFRYFDWTISSGDAGETKNTNQIVQNVTSSLKEDGLNVVLMHDIKSYSVDAVERIIQYGLANGYTFAPLTMESPITHQKINN